MENDRPWAHSLGMARERYSAPLKCPQCGQEGRAQMSDAKSFKIESDYDTRVDSAVPFARNAG